jgi:cytochrome c oxidase subunit 1
MSSSIKSPDHAGHIPYFAAEGKYPVLIEWLLSTNHKRIGILYLYGIVTSFVVGVILGVIMRLELMAPGVTVVQPQTYNALFTLHGVIMIFMVVIPAVPAVFGNFFIPLLIGAEDMAFPRLNLATFYLYVIGGTLALVSLFTGGGPVDTGWTFYVPYSLRTTVNVPLAVFGVFLLGMSSMLTGLNIIATVHQYRAPGMTWNRLPLSAWAMYATAWVQLLATPVIGITLLLIIVEIIFGVGVFDPNKGGDPLLYQHLFWIYSHPAVYIMILPAMGIISDIIPVFARKNIFGYKAIAYSSIAIASIGSLVWGHHMFVSGQSGTATIVFSFLTFLVAVPSAVKVFNWVATLYKGSIQVAPPFLYALTFIFFFIIGGLSGLIQGAIGPDVHLTDTYFVVAHLHYVIFGGMGFGVFAAFHYWLPKMSGRMYDQKIATISWIINFVGFNLLYFPMFVMGWEGMPRRYFDYLPKYAPMQFLSTVGSWILVAGLALMIGNLVRSVFKGESAGDNPWGGATLEWQISSPPGHENFDGVPVVTHGPYAYKEAIGSELDVDTKGEEGRNV